MCVCVLRFIKQANVIYLRHVYLIYTRTYSHTHTLYNVYKNLYMQHDKTNLYSKKIITRSRGFHIVLICAIYEFYMRHIPSSSYIYKARYIHVYLHIYIYTCYNLSVAARKSIYIDIFHMMYGKHMRKHSWARTRLPW